MTQTSYEKRKLNEFTRRDKGQSQIKMWLDFDVKNALQSIRDGFLSWNEMMKFVIQLNDHHLGRDTSGHEPVVMSFGSSLSFPQVMFIKGESLRTGKTTDAVLNELIQEAIQARSGGSS